MMPPGPMPTMPSPIGGNKSGKEKSSKRELLRAILPVLLVGVMVQELLAVTLALFTGQFTPVTFYRAWALVWMVVASVVLFSVGRLLSALEEREKDKESIASQVMNTLAQLGNPAGASGGIGVEIVKEPKKRVIN